MNEYPEDCRFTREHEWVRAQGDRGTVGITHYAQKQLGDVVYLELPEIGRAMKAHEQFGTVESVKAVSELYAPATGTVTEVNNDLATAPEKVNAQPYAAWMIKIRLKDPKETSGLMDAKAYEKYASERG